MGFLGRLVGGCLGGAFGSAIGDLFENSNKNKSIHSKGSINEANKPDNCVKCGHSDFEYDSYWKEYACKHCGWTTE